MARRRRNRTSGAAVEVDEGIAVSDLLRCHLLLTPATVDPEDVSRCLRDRLPGSDLAGAGEVTFGRRSRLSGPYLLTLEDAVDAAVPMPWTVCYCLETPVEREDPPLPGVDDRDGFAYAFPDGLPWRDEGRALLLMVALARRLRGAVRVAGSLQVIMPDHRRAVDHIVHSPNWLEPEDLLAVVGRELPGARLATEGVEWNGPPDAAYTGELVAADIAADPLSAAELDRLHAAADARDMDVLSGDDVLDAFAISGDLGQDGLIEVLVHLNDGDDPAVAAEPWARQEYATYEVRWSGTDPAERERRYPSDRFLASRIRAQLLVRAVTRSIIEVTGGVVLDEDGFRVDRHRL